jgi:hypothetical protein
LKPWRCKENQSFKDFFREDHENTRKRVKYTVTALSFLAISGGFFRQMMKMARENAYSRLGQKYSRSAVHHGLAPKHAHADPDAGFCSQGSYTDLDSRNTGSLESSVAVLLSSPLKIQPGGFP